MHKSGEDLKIALRDGMVIEGILVLYSDPEFKIKELKEQLEVDKGIEELAEYYAQKTLNMTKERSQSIPSKEAFRLKYPEDYQRIAKLRHASVYNTWVNPADEKEEYSLLLQKEHNSFKEYLIDKKKQGLSLNEYEERNLEYMLVLEKHKEKK